MNLDLIELQRGCPATAVIINNDEYKNLNNSLSMSANLLNDSMFISPDGSPIFKEKLEKISKGKDISYFIIKDIETVREELQLTFAGLVKDREIFGYNIPSNVIIVFTVKNKLNLTKISRELAHFCVVA